MRDLERFHRHPGVPQQHNRRRRSRGIDGVASAGERALLHAILHAGDFDWLADELAAGKAWYRLSSLSGAHALAAAACIARIG